MSGLSLTLPLAGSHTPGDASCHVGVLRKRPPGCGTKAAFQQPHLKALSLGVICCTATIGLSCTQDSCLVQLLPVAPLF